MLLGASTDVKSGRGTARVTCVLLKLWQTVSEVQRVLCRNADVSNTFKVDLHALHVDEALEELQKTMDDLSHFQCKTLSRTYMLRCLGCAIDAELVILQFF